LDFATEDVEFADREKFYSLINQVSISIEQLIASFQLGNVIKNGVSVAIIGKPNAGKSTLLNCLLNEDRAIVSEIAGTTRDTIEETINIHGIIFRLIDTAGIRDHSNDLIENIGIEKSLEKMHAADLVLYLFDVNTEKEEEVRQQQAFFEENGIRFLLVGNKFDIQNTNDLMFSENSLLISAKNNIGIDELKDKIYALSMNDSVSTDQTIITNLRHLQELKKVNESIGLIKNGLDTKLSGDLLAIEIRTCLYHLGEITGEVTNEDKLDYIFSKFCIGK